jgi:recombination protein RecR
MVLHFLEKDRDGGQRLADALIAAMEGVGQCEQCRTLSEDSLCRICASTSRDRSILCVVETPADVFAIEHTGTFKGIYYVLMGHLSPIDGIGPEEIGVSGLVDIVRDSKIIEVILATNPTVEGEATAYFISEQLKTLEFQGMSLKISRIAHGVPIGSELEYIDAGTLVHSFAGRQLMSD